MRTNPDRLPARGHLPPLVAALLALAALVSADQSAPRASSAVDALPAPAALCQLGNDSYQLGDRWHPNLTPFGLQFCVLCECAFRQRKSCYEIKVTCRRLHNECPAVPDLCPDGSRPATKPAQCCKGCPTGPKLAGEQLPDQQSISSTSTARPRVHKNLYKPEHIREFKRIIKVSSPCNSRRENPDRLLYSSSSSSANPKSKINKLLASGHNQLRTIDPAATETSFRTANCSRPLQQQQQQQQQQQLQPPATSATSSCANQTSAEAALASLRDYNRQQSKNLHLQESLATPASHSSQQHPQEAVSKQPILGQLFTYLINLMTRRGLTNYLDSSCPNCKH